MNANRSLLILGLCSALAACSSNPKVETIDPALLAHISTESRAIVNEARQSVLAAEDAHAVARNETQRATNEMRKTRANLETEKARVAQSKLEVEVAENSGTVGALEDAQMLHTYEEAIYGYETNKLAVKNRELDVAKLEEELALEKLHLAKSNVELTKAEALQQVDMVAAKKVPVEDYRKQVTHHSEKIEDLRTQIRKERAQLVEAQGMLADLKLEVDAKQPREDS